MVERSWMAAFDSPEFWNPKVKGAECLNRQAARSILPIADLRTRMVMAGHSKAEIVSAMKAAFDNKQLPDLDNGAMAFMMSKSAYLTDEGDHNGPHLMFFTALKDGKYWGCPYRKFNLPPENTLLVALPTLISSASCQPRRINSSSNHTALFMSMFFAFHLASSYAALR
jgi:hypothetical protein